MRFFFLFLVCAKIAFGALPATAIWNITKSATGGNVNGAFFNVARGGTDYSLQNGAQLHLTNFTTTGAASTTLTSVTGGFTSAMVGNGIHIVSGTNFTADWYEIVTFTDTNNVILDRAPSPGGVGALGDGYVGGSASLESTTDDDIFEKKIGGMIYYVKSGTYTLGEQVNISTTGSLTVPAWIIGYTSTQGDSCTGSSRPIFNSATVVTTLSNFYVKNLQFTSTATTFTFNQGAYYYNVKGINKSTNTGATCYSSTSNTLVDYCEFVCYRGKAFQLGGADPTVQNSVIHDSRIGIAISSGVTGSNIINNLIYSCYNQNINFDSAQTARCGIINNTIFGGATTKLGVGIQMFTGTTNVFVQGNIIMGHTTGVAHPDTQTQGIDDYNNYYNNTADVSAAGQWQKGSHDTTANPVFASAGQVTGATATTTAGDHLVQSGALFITGTNQVVAGRDYLYVVSGTGVTAGYYGISSVDSDTQITADITLTANATADKVFYITTGHNFAPGVNVAGLRGPAFQGGYTQGYADPGAAQQQGFGGGGDSVFSK